VEECKPLMLGSTPTAGEKHLSAGGHLPDLSSDDDP
jgi:hypothetical protein